MRLELRPVLAVMLWLVAAWPVALILIARSAPQEAVRTELFVRDLLRGVGLYAGLAAILLMVLWPPFLPGLVLRYQRLKKRLAVNRIPTFEALERLRRFENPADLAIAGRGLLAQGMAGQAAAHLERALQLDPSDLRTAYALAEARTAQGHLVDAARLLEAVVAREPEHAFGEALLRLCDLRLRLGNAAAAAAGLRVWVDRYGKKREALHHLAMAQIELGEVASATTTLTDAVRPLSPEEAKDAGARYWRAKAKVLAWKRGGKR